MKTTITDRRILGLAWPSIVQNATVPLLGLCDVAIMGHVGGATHIGAIAVGSMIFNVAYWLLGFLRMGTSGLTAQARGARQWGVCTALLRRGLLMGAGLGLLMVILQMPLRQLALWLMQVPDGVSLIATPYYNICIWGAPAVLSLYALTGWLIGMQDTRTPMFIAVGQNVLNIVLSLCLVVGLGMGVEGVALGTVVAQWAGLLAALLMVVRRYGRQLRQTVAGRATSMRHYLRLNLDIFLRTVCLVAVNLYFTSAGASQGDLTLAANTLLMQLFMFFSYVMDGFAFAGEALAGRYLGAGRRDRLQFTVNRLFRWGVGVALVFTLAYWLGGQHLLRLLTTDVQVVATAQSFLPWAVLIPVAGMAAFVWDGIFIGTTMTRGMLVSCFWATAVFFVLWFSLNPTMGNHALWLALLAYLIMRGLLQTLLWHRRWE